MNIRSLGCCATAPFPVESSPGLPLIVRPAGRGHPAGLMELSGGVGASSGSLTERPEIGGGGGGGYEVLERMMRSPPPDHRVVVTFT